MVRRALVWAIGVASVAIGPVGGAATAQDRAEPPIRPIETRTANGLRIWAFPDDDGGSQFALAVLVGTGSRDEGSAPSGIAHLLEHVVFARAGDRPKAAADRELRARARVWNGYTSTETTLYFLAVDGDDWHWAVDWLADHVVRPVFADDDVAAEREIVRQELAARSPHAGAVTFEGLIYPGQPLGRSIGGDARSVMATDAATLRAFHARHYRAGNVAVGFCGPVAAAECAAAIERAFAALPGGEPEGDGRDGPARPRSGMLVLPGGFRSGTVTLTVGWHLPAATVRDHAAAQALGAFADDRLFAELREERHVTYTPSADVVVHRDTQRLECDVTLADGSDQSAVLAVLDGLAERVRGAAPADLVDARTAAASALAVTSIDDLNAAMELAWRLALVGASPSDYVAAAAALDDETLAAFAAQWLVPANRYVASTAPIGTDFTLWTGLALLLLAIVAIDAFGGFRRSRALGAAVQAVVRRWRRPRPRGAVVAMRSPAPPPRRVDGDEIERDIQRWLEDERDAD